MGEFTSESLRQRADRLDVLAHAVTEANWSEFSMRVPVEPERDADCVLSSAARELRAYATLLEQQASAVPDKWAMVPREPTNEMCGAPDSVWHPEARKIWQQMFDAAPQPKVRP